MRKKGQGRVSSAKSAAKEGAKKRPSDSGHIRKISPGYRKREGRLSEKGAKEGKKRHPLGIRVLVAYLSLLLGFYFFYLFLGIKSPIAVAFGQVIGGVPALLLIMFLIVVAISLIAGLLRRKKWGYYLALAVFGFGIINSLVSLALLQPDVVSFTRSFLILSSVTVLVVDILAILYVLSEKNYFFARQFAEKKTRVVDKVFVAAMIIFLIITISIGASLGYDFYRTNIEQTDIILSELEGRFANEQIEVCNAKEGQQRDLCLLILSIISADRELCGQIQSDFYRFSCLQA